MKKDLEVQSSKLNTIVSELQLAIKHAQIAASHFLAAEVPRACAHTLAIHGHIEVVNEALIEIAKLHKTKANV